MQKRRDKKINSLLIQANAVLYLLSRSFVLEGNYNMNAFRK
jgi:hypothetical protein